MAYHAFFQDGKVQVANTEQKRRFRNGICSTERAFGKENTRLVHPYRSLSREERELRNDRTPCARRPPQPPMDPNLTCFLASISTMVGWLHYVAPP